MRKIKLVSQKNWGSTQINCTTKVKEGAEVIKSLTAGELVFRN